MLSNTKPRVRALRSVSASLAIAAALLAQPSFAQDAAAEDEADAGDIVVTGTLIRGVVPAGAQQFTIDAQQIESKSIQSTDQLLATIPQLSSFGNLQTVNAGGTQLTVNRTNIRSLPQSIGGSSPTLVLLDGHRIVGAGVRHSYPDPDVIPPMLVERVEVLTDGGSASYGSDAMGGVINFTTKKSFDGIQAGIRQGIGDEYRSTDVNFLGGKAWDTGSVYVGYNFSYHNAVFGSARDFIKNIDWATGLPASKACNPANVTVAGQTYAVIGGNSLQLSNANLCDTSKTEAFYPRETRHSVMAGFRQDLTDSIEFEVKGYYSQRKNKSNFAPLQGNAASVLGAAVPANPGFPPFVPATPAQPANPNYISIGGGSTATQAVAFDFSRWAGLETNDTNLRAWGITPSLTWKIGSDWQMKAFFNYGESKTTANNPDANDTLLASFITSGAINPYNVARSSPAALAQVLDWTNYGVGKSRLTNAKVTFDGPLIDLPGGELRVAVGGEYIGEKFSGNVATGTNQAARALTLNTAAATSRQASPKPASRWSVRT